MKTKVTNDLMEDEVISGFEIIPTTGDCYRVVPADREIPAWGPKTSYEEAASYCEALEKRVKQYKCGAWEAMQSTPQFVKGVSPQKALAGWPDGFNY